MPGLAFDVSFVVDGRPIFVKGGPREKTFLLGLALTVVGIDITVSLKLRMLFISSLGTHCYYSHLCFVIVHTLYQDSGLSLQQGCLCPFHCFLFGLLLCFMLNLSPFQELHCVRRISV